MSGTSIWIPGIAGPLDELVQRIQRMVRAFAEENGLEAVEVRVELADGSHHLLQTMSAEPGFGFISFVPHQGPGEEPRRLIVPIAAVKVVEISAPDVEQAFGFAPAPE